MPVIIYAIVRFGSYPVQNAKVSAIIQKPDGEEDNLDLNDDGRGGNYYYYCYYYFLSGSTAVRYPNSHGRTLSLNCFGILLVPS